MSDMVNDEPSNGLNMPHFDDLMEDDTNGPVHSGDPMLSSPHLPPLSPPSTTCCPRLPNDDDDDDNEDDDDDNNNDHHVDDDTLSHLAPTNGTSDMDITS